MRFRRDNCVECEHDRKSGWILWTADCTEDDVEERTFSVLCVLIHCAVIDYVVVNCVVPKATLT